MSITLEEINRRVTELEQSVKELDSRMKNREIVEAETKVALESLRSEFIGLKAEIMTTLTQYTNRTWKLIFVLVALLAVSFGITDGPEIIKTFLSNTP